MTTPEIPETKPAAGGLSILKPGQAVATRWAAYLLLGALLFMGVRSLFGFLYREGTTPLVADLPVVGDVTWVKIICAVLFVFGAWGIHRLLNRASAVDLLVETEQEMRKVSWPSRGEVKNATMVVALVTVVIGAILFWADELLMLLFRFIF